MAAVAATLVATALVRMLGRARGLWLRRLVGERRLLPLGGRLLSGVGRRVVAGLGVLRRAGDLLLLVGGRSADTCQLQDTVHAFRLLGPQHDTARSAGRGER